MALKVHAVCELCAADAACLEYNVYAANASDEKIIIYLFIIML